MKMKFILIVKYVNKQECLDVNITSQICSLDLAIQLKKLGVKQDSLFYRFDHGSHQYIFCREYEQYSTQVNLDINDGYSAFTSEEVGAMLPDSIKDNDNDDCFIKSQKKDDEYKIYLDLNGKCIMFFGEKETNARAKMLIYLIENKLMDLPK